MATAGCLRHEMHERPVRSGSIKDDQATARPVAKPSAATQQPVKAQAVAASHTVVQSGVQPAPATPRQASEVPVAAPTSTAPPPRVTAPARPPEAPDVQTTEVQLEEGRTLFAAGQVIESRKRFMAALNGPIPEALLALARSFDTFYLSQLPRSDGAPDVTRATILYERAVERGSVEAQADLARLKATLGQKQ